MKNNFLLILVFLGGIGVSYLESVWLFLGIWLIFLPLIWRLKVKVEEWWYLAFALGLIRDLFLGSSLGKSSFIFLLIVILFQKITENYRQPNRLLS